MNQPIDASKSSKIIIRIKVPSAADAVAISNNNSDKSLTMLLTFVVLVFLLAGGAWYWLSDQNTADNDIESAANQQSTEFVQAPAIIESSQINQNESPLSASSNTLVENDDVIVKSKPAFENNQEVSENQILVTGKDISPLSEATNALVEANGTIEKPASAFKSTQVVVEEPLLVSEKDTSPSIEVTESTSNKNESDLVSETSVPAEQEGSTNNKNKDITKNVARATFAHDISNREPVNLIEGAIVAKPEGLKRVYFFSELRNMKGKKILHRWIYNGKIQSDVKFNVGGNRWRIYSSKRIISAKTGIWQVDIVEQDSQQVLATRKFTYGQ